VACAKDVYALLMARAMFGADITNERKKYGRVNFLVPLPQEEEYACNN
jgi:hypothetical protein